MLLSRSVHSDCTTLLEEMILDKRDYVLCTLVTVSVLKNYSKYKGYSVILLELEALCNDMNIFHNVCVYIYTHICTYIYIHTHTHTHTHTHIYIYIYMN